METFISRPGRRFLAKVEGRTAEELETAAVNEARKFFASGCEVEVDPVYMAEVDKRELGYADRPTVYRANIEVREIPDLA